jgi:hypothetical protein
MAHGAGSGDLPVARFESVPRGIAGAIVGLIGVGLAAFAGAVLTDPVRAWHAYQFNWLYFTSLAQGAVMLAVIVTITRGKWSRSIRRIALSFVAFLPVAYLLVIPMFFTAGRIFPWVNEPVPGKEVWLNVPFLVIRTLVLLAVLFGLSIVFARAALRPDAGLLRERMSGSLAALYARMTAGWQGQEREELLAYRKLAKLGPAIALAWAVAFSVVAFDFVMSLEPHWFSTLIGPYFFMAGLLAGLAATGIATFWFTRSLGVEGAVDSSHYHDLGKLTFGFIVFWGYLFFSQYIVIWYGLLPGEQSFVIHRFTAPFGIIAKLVILLVFVVPFFGLLSATPKKTPRLLTLFGGILLLGMWLERYLLVYPSSSIGARSLPLGWQEIGTALLFAGLLLASLMWFLTRFPVFQLWQPLSEIQLEGVEVEATAPASNV